MTYDEGPGVWFYIIVTPLPFLSSRPFPFLSSRPRSSFARLPPEGRKNGVSGEISPCATLSRDDMGEGCRDDMGA